MESGDLTTMAFSVGSADCRAIREARTYLARRSGLRDPRWRLRKDGYAIEPRDIDLALGSLQVQQYEARGNLRAPPQ